MANPSSMKVLVVSLHLGGPPGLRSAVQAKGLTLVPAYGMRNGNSFCSPSDGCDYPVNSGDFVAAIVDDHLMDGLDNCAIIGALGQLNIPCIALTSTGFDPRADKAGAVIVILRNLITDLISDDEVDLERL